MTIGPFKGSFRWLSNFTPSPVELGGVSYPTVEHAYQAAKTTVPEERFAVKVCATPGQAKRMGRKVTLRPEWSDDMYKNRVMLSLLIQKFSSEPLRGMLLGTGKEEIVEINHWHDNYWGRCTCPRCKKIYANNYLGRLLMLVRRGLELEDAHQTVL